MSKVPITFRARKAVLCLPCLHSRDQSFKNIENDKKTGLWAMSCATIECFHMTSRQPYSSPKTMKRRPCFCPKPIFWEVYSFLEQTLSFVPINLHRCWPREWKHSIQQVLISKICLRAWRVIVPFEKPRLLFREAYAFLVTWSERVSSRIRHRNALTRNVWKNAVHGQGKV